MIMVVVTNNKIMLIVTFVSTLALGGGVGLKSIEIT